MTNNSVPSDLKRGKVSPIFKGGSRGDPKNYRPITLTSHVMKVCEKVVARALINYLEEKQLMNKDQHGFRHGKSCLSQLWTHYETVLYWLETGAEVDVLYLDFARAFEKVDFDLLLEKLAELGVGGQLRKWIEAFLRDRVHYVMVDGVVSDERTVVSGVPQGSVLGPILFLVYIADINANVASSRVSSFADDTRISKPIYHETDRGQLQEDLNTIYSWVDLNNMKLNGNKLKLL